MGNLCLYKKMDKLSDSGSRDEIMKNKLYRKDCGEITNCWSPVVCDSNYVCQPE